MHAMDGETKDTMIRRWQTEAPAIVAIPAQTQAEEVAGVPPPF